MGAKDVVAFNSSYLCLGSTAGTSSISTTHLQLSDAAKSSRELPFEGRCAKPFRASDSQA